MYDIKNHLNKHLNWPLKQKSRLNLTRRNFELDIEK